MSLLFLTLLATASAVLSWERLKELPFNLGGIPAGVLMLASLFAFYTWKQRSEIGELRGFLRGMQDRAEAPPTEDQLRKLFDIVAQSQHGYRELIDSFDDVVFSAGLDGRILTCNRRCADLLGQPFQRMFLQTVEEMIAEPAWTDVQAALPRFLDKRHWQGVVRVRLRPNGRVMYFDVNLQAIVSDGQVSGVTFRRCLRVYDGQRHFAPQFDDARDFDGGRRSGTHPVGGAEGDEPSGLPLRTPCAWKGQANEGRAQSCRFDASSFLPAARNMPARGHKKGIYPEAPCLH